MLPQCGPEWGSVWGSVEFKKGKIADAGRYCNRESGITETGGVE